MWWRVPPTRHHHMTHLHAGGSLLFRLVLGSRPRPRGSPGCRLDGAARPTGLRVGRQPAMDRSVRRGRRQAVAETTVITFGTFDVLHVGHVRVLNRAASYGDR